MKGEEKKSRKDLVELLETEYEDREEATLLLEKAFALKQQRDSIEEQYKEAVEDLAVHQKVSGLEGLRHNHIAFVLTYMEGRTTTDPKVLAETLVTNGVRPELVKQCFAAAEKQGDGYYKREVVDLTPKEKGKKEKGAWT